MLQSVEGRTFPFVNITYTLPMPYFINIEFYVTTEKDRHPILPEGVFVIPPPHSRLRNATDGIRSRVPNDFSASEDKISLS